MDFIYEEYDLPGFFLNLLEHCLQAVFEFSPVFGAGDQRPQIQGDDLFVCESCRDIAIDNPLSKALDDGGLADPGFTDQNGVVLCSA